MQVIRITILDCKSFLGWQMVFQIFVKAALRTVFFFEEGCS